MVTRNHDAKLSGTILARRLDLTKMVISRSGLYICGCQGSCIAHQPQISPMIDHVFKSGFLDTLVVSNPRQRSVLHRALSDMGWIIKITAVVVVVSLAYTLLRKLWGSSISDVRGPNDSASFFLGPFTPAHLVCLALTESSA